MTQRLRLREMTHDDLDFIATMLGDRDVMQLYPSLTREESLGWIDRQIRATA